MQGATKTPFAGSLCSGGIIVEQSFFLSGATSGQKGTPRGICGSAQENENTKCRAMLCCAESPGARRVRGERGI